MEMNATGFVSLQVTVNGDQSGVIFSLLYRTCKLADRSTNSKNSKGFLAQTLFDMRCPECPALGTAFMLCVLECVCRL